MRKGDFIFGAFLLTISAIVAKVLGAVYRVPLTSLLGAEGMGLYQLVFPIFAFLLSLISSGLPVALSRNVSERVAKEKYLDAKVFFHASIYISFVLGFLFFILLFLFSGGIAKLQNNSSIAVCYKIIAPSILFASLLSSFKGYYQGLEIMQVSAKSNIIEQFFKLVLGLTLAVFAIKKGVIFGVAGAVLGITLSEVIAFLYVYFSNIFLRRKLPKTNLNKEERIPFFLALKTLLRDGFPITLQGLVLPLLAVFDSIFVTKFLMQSGINSNISISLYGLADGVVSSLVMLPSVVAISLVTALIPQIAKLNEKKDFSRMHEKVHLSFKLVSMISIFASGIFFVFSREILSFLYVGKNSNLGTQEILIASNLLKIGGVSVIYISFLQVFAGILQALKHSGVAVRNLLIGAVFKLILTPILVLNTKFNIYGMLISDTVCFSVTMLLNMVSLSKLVDIQISIADSFLKEVLSLILSIFSIKLSLRVLNMFFTSRFLILVALFIGGVVYLLFSYIFKLISTKDLTFLKRTKKLVKK